MRIYFIVFIIMNLRLLIIHYRHIDYKFSNLWSQRIVSQHCEQELHSIHNSGIVLVCHCSRVSCWWGTQERKKRDQERETENIFLYSFLLFFSFIFTPHSSMLHKANSWCDKWRNYWKLKKETKDLFFLYLLFDV